MRLGALTERCFDIAPEDLETATVGRFAHATLNE